MADDLRSVFSELPRDATGREFAPAQTQVQLLEQLRTAGLSVTAQGEVQRAYRLAMELFSGCYRPSGRVFLSHLIGTASIAAHFDARVELVAAGLLHSAYSHGEFGNGVRGVTESRRASVRRAVGASVEERIHCYDQLCWDAKEIQQAIDSLSSADSLRRDVLLLALANSFDDYLDIAAALRGSAAGRDQIRLRGALEIELAERLGCPALAAAHARIHELALARDRSTDLLPELELPRRSIELTGGGSSILVPPASHTMNTTAWLRRLLRRHSPRFVRWLRMRDRASGPPTSG